MQPGGLRGPEQLAVGPGQIGDKCGRIQSLLGGVVRIVQLLFAPNQAGIQHVQGDKTAKVEAAVDDVGLRDAGRHPLVIGLKGCGTAQFEIAFIGLMVLGAVLPGVVGDFMVVPHRNHRHGCMQGLQIRVRLVLGMALAVVGQHQQFIGRVGHPSQRGGIGRGIAIRGVLVDVIAQVNGGVQVGALGGFGIDVEVAGRVVRAGKHRQLDLACTACGQGLRLADRRLLIDDAEAIEISGCGAELVDIDLDRIVDRCAGGREPETHDVAERFVRCNLPANIDRPGGIGCDSSPEHHPVRQRVAARHAMFPADRNLLDLLVTAAGDQPCASDQGNACTDVPKKTASGRSYGARTQQVLAAQKGC